jgi:hypothetical protein
VLGRAIQAIINPISGATAAVTMAATALWNYLKSLRDAGEQTALTAQELTALQVAQWKSAEAWEKLERSLKAVPMENATSWLERQNAAIKEYLENTLNLAEAQKALRIAEINLAESKGQISPGEAEGQRLGVEVAFGEFATEERARALEQMIANRRAAIEMARREAEQTAEQARRAREIAEAAQMTATEKSIQARRFGEKKPEIDVGGFWDQLVLGPAWEWAAQSERETKTAHERMRLLIEMGAARTAERARWAQEAAQEAERRAVEARGRLGGLSGGDEIGRLERQSEVLRERGTLERRARLTEGEAGRERAAREAREQRAQEIMREFGARLTSGAGVRELNDSLRALLVELQRLGLTAAEVRRVTEELRRTNGGVNGRLP